MRHAIALSALGLGSTSPNPPVGCVVLDPDGCVAGKGWHERKGEPHAEVHALAAAGERAAGGTAVVTLEPCCHHGRTPPCHQALIDAGIRRVVIAILDPTSRAEGGAARLRNAGVSVEVGVLGDEALLVLGSWLEALHLGRPLVTWVYEAGRDGPVVASADVLTRMRTRFDAVLHDDDLHEGIPGAHGPEAFSLPARLPDPSRERLAALYDMGTRKLLLHGDENAGRPYLDAGVMDSVTVHLSTGAGDLWLPQGFELWQVERLDDGALVYATASASR